MLPWTRVAAIRAAGDPTSIADLKPAAIPAEVNAAVQLDRLTPRMQTYDFDERRLYRTAVGNDLRQITMGPQNPLQGPPTPGQIEAMRAVREQSDDLEQMILLASWYKQYASTIEFSLDAARFEERLQSVQMRGRAIARLIDVRTRLLVSEGRREEAIERWLAVLRLARLHANEPWAGYLVFALRDFAMSGIHAALDSGPVGRETRSRLDAELALAYDPQVVPRALRGSRAISISKAEDHAAQMAAPLRPVLGWTITWPLLGMLEDYEAVLPMVSRPWPEMVQRVFPQYAGKKVPPNGNFGAPITILLLRSDLRALAKIRSLRVINALGLFAEANGRQAKGVEELTLPRDVLSDPFTAGPLVVRRQDGTWLAYSVGDDGVDNLGALVGRAEFDYGWASTVRGE